MFMNELDKENWEEQERCEQQQSAESALLRNRLARSSWPLNDRVGDKACQLDAGVPSTHVGGQTTQWFGNEHRNLIDFFSLKMWEIGNVDTSF